MKSMATVLHTVFNEGYTEDFKATADGLVSVQHARVYQPEEVTIVNYFRFEGTSNPDDEAVVYVIETTDGTKGTLTDAYGVYMDPHVSAFIKEVKNIQKKAV